MITHLRIENFKCLRDVSADLRPLTALVGGNDAGKSSILEAILALSKATRSPLSTSLDPSGPTEGLPFEEIVSDGDTSKTIAWEVRASAGLADRAELPWRVELHAGPTDSAALRSAIAPHSTSSASCASSPTSPTLSDAASALGSVGRYRFDPRALRSPSALSARPALSPTGDNLAAVLDAILCGPFRSAGASIDAALHASIPTVSGVSLRTIEREGGRVEKAIELVLASAPGSESAHLQQTRERKRTSIPAAHASEGALLLTAALALAHGDSPDILLFESPEAGLHPGQLRVLAGILRRISEGSEGGIRESHRPRQVILTTYSPILLNYLKPEEILLVRRDHERDLGTRIDPLTSAPNLSELLRATSVGELWSLLAEDGLLGP